MRFSVPLIGLFSLGSLWWLVDADVAEIEEAFRFFMIAEDSGDLHIRDISTVAIEQEPTTSPGYPKYIITYESPVDTVLLVSGTVWILAESKRADVELSPCLIILQESSAEEGG